MQQYIWIDKRLNFQLSEKVNNKISFGSISFVFKKCCIRFTRRGSVEDVRSASPLNSTILDY